MSEHCEYADFYRSGEVGKHTPARSMKFIDCCAASL